MGNIVDKNIKDILSGTQNLKLKKDMLDETKPSNCSGCYLQEKNRKSLASISSRLYYLKEIVPGIDLEIFNDIQNFSLKHVDLRWTNACNQACVYCDPGYSSKWAQELGVKVKSNDQARKEVKNFVFENIKQLKNVYLAGGEPMLMKENKEFLGLLKKNNPECSIRVNTNLSTTKTGIFELLCSFKNVHWTVSVESIEDEYEYIRYHGVWQDFNQNLDVIRKLDHKISFNMLHLILNYDSIHDCIDFLKSKNFNDNSFIIGPMFTPRFLSILNLPGPELKFVIEKLKKKVNDNAMGYLKNSYENLIKFYSANSSTEDRRLFFDGISDMDARRRLDSRNIFKKLYKVMDDYTLE